MNYLNTMFPFATQGHSYVLNVQSPSEIRINSPIPIPRSPTKDLFDRLAYLSGRYRKPFLPGSIPPTDQAFDDAKTFILSLPLATIKNPSIHVAADGEVNFQW